MADKLKSSHCQALLGSLVAMALIAFGSSLSCIQCSSLEEPVCLVGRGPSKVCNRTYDYCVTYMGHVNKVEVNVIFRGCSNVDIRHSCSFQTHNQSGLMVDVLSCIKSCKTDNCNSDPMPIILQETDRAGSIYPNGILCLLFMVSVIGLTAMSSLLQLN